jgi:hypothetical protein
MVKTVAVYGSSMVQPDQADYKNAYEVGRMLGSAGYTVMTGGYAGVMEAASKGAAMAGGHVIGVTTDVFKLGRGDGVQANAWVANEIRHPTLRERLLHLVLEADAYVTMPGGLGTLHELITVWELIRVGDIPARPLICYGDYWDSMLATMRESPYVKQTAWDLLAVAHAPEEILALLQKEPYL